MEFIEYLKGELTRRGWSYSELARRADISQGMISQVIAGDANPGKKFFAGVAEALGMPVSDLMRMAGMLEEWPDQDDPALSELEVMIRRIPRGMRASLLTYARFLDGRVVHAVKESGGSYGEEVVALVSKLTPEQQAALVELLRVLVG